MRSFKKKGAMNQRRFINKGMKYYRRCFIIRIILEALTIFAAKDRRRKGTSTEVPPKEERQGKRVERIVSTGSQSGAWTGPN
jgi:hypothetical protein